MKANRKTNTHSGQQYINIVILVFVSLTSYFVFFASDMYSKLRTCNTHLGCDTSINSISNENLYDYRLINVKFRESSQVRLRNQGLISLANKDLSLITNLLSNSNIAQISRLSSLPEATIEQLRLEQVANGSRDVIDLNSNFVIVLQPEAPTTFSKNLIAELETHPDVETVYPEPIFTLPGGKQIQTVAAPQDGLLGYVKAKVIVLLSQIR